MFGSNQRAKGRENKGADVFAIVRRRLAAPSSFARAPRPRDRTYSRLANFERYFESIARPFEWKFTRADLTALIARMRSRWAQSQHLKLAA